MTVTFRSSFWGSLTAAVVLLTAVAPAQSPDIPIVAGVNFVLAVSNPAANRTSSANEPAGILQVDYEMVVAITNLTAAGITHTAWFDGVDAGGIQRGGGVGRLVTTDDVANAPVQIFGFHLSDPPRADGATALGPSLSITRALAQNGTTPYWFRQWVGREVISGPLRRSASSPVNFPVLLNGKRVVLDAIHATGQMALGSAKRPFETVILDHPKYPLSLRIAHGPRDSGFPVKPDFVREIVRIDVPTPHVPIVDALNKECRVELKGIYFDFNQATLQPQSEGALKEIANALGTARRRVAIEGHTDNIGSDGYMFRATGSVARTAGSDHRAGPMCGRSHYGRSTGYREAV